MGNPRVCSLPCEIRWRLLRLAPAGPRVLPVTFWCHREVLAVSERNEFEAKVQLIPPHLPQVSPTNASSPSRDVSACGAVAPRLSVTRAPPAILCNHIAMAPPLRHVQGTCARVVARW